MTSNHSILYVLYEYILRKLTRTYMHIHTSTGAIFPPSNATHARPTTQAIPHLKSRHPRRVRFPNSDSQSQSHPDRILSYHQTPSLPIYYVVFPSSKILLSRRRNPLSKNGTGDLHVDRVERVHQTLDPNLVHLGKEQSNGFLRLRRGRIRRDRTRPTPSCCPCPCSCPCSSCCYSPSRQATTTHRRRHRRRGAARRCRGRVMQQQEFDIYTGPAHRQPTSVSVFFHSVICKQCFSLHKKKKKKQNGDCSLMLETYLLPPVKKHET